MTESATRSTQTVWFGDPTTDYICEETGEEAILMKDNTGKVIGFEKLNFLPVATEQIRVAFETIAG